MDSSPLARIPGELRNRIYEFTLYEPHGIPFTLGRQHTSPVFQRKLPTDASGLNKRPHKTALHGLPVTCKAIRNETSKLYFSINNLYIRIGAVYPWLNSYPLLSSTLARWIDAVGTSNASQLNSICLDLEAIEHPSWTIQLVQEIRALVASRLGRSIPFSFMTDMPRLSKLAMHIHQDKIDEAIEEVIATANTAYERCTAGTAGPRHEIYRQELWVLEFLRKTKAHVRRGAQAQGKQSEAQ